MRWNRPSGAVDHCGRRIPGAGAAEPKRPEMSGRLWREWTGSRPVAVKAGRNAAASGFCEDGAGAVEAGKAGVARHSASVTAGPFGVAMTLPR